ncbi:3-hydroxyacyl-CoA dehydrogenase [Nitrospiraceae bacterium AH_259_D15_M11_P09]|nr:3-hydroxyacyl-CoA dehydrogenase [Nitrospiraceae bacterium AH_259_D15_M11_P09]
MYIYKVGVVGAGTMGAQIAQVVSFAGIPVLLTDVNEAAVQRGLQTVRSIYQVRVDKGKMTAEQLEEKMLLMTAVADVRALKDVDLVVEAIPEVLKLKQQLFRELDTACSPGAILASNTSALSISALGAVTQRPSKVLGLHFFNPAYAMPLVEVIPGLLSDSQTVDDVVGFAESIRKAPIVVKECAGFLVNRLLMPYVNEAILCLQEGTTSLKEIDQEMTAFGMPVGPFTLLDQLGLDIAAEVARILHQSYGPRMAPAALLDALVKAGRLGVKSGRGFYNYRGANQGEGDGELERLIHQIKEEAKIKAEKDQAGRRKTTSTSARLLLPMVNEAATALQEGVSSARDIDLAMVAGIGFPTDKEGPLHYADRLGIDHVLGELEGFSQSLGMRFWPAPILRRMVDAGLTGRSAGRGFFMY